MATTLAGAAEDWLEIDTPNFIVVSNAGARRAREVGRELEQIRLIFRAALVHADRDPAQPVVVFAVKDEDGLKELLPEFWEQKGGARPGGVFIRTTGKHLVGLRADLSRRSRYQAIYHEYFHLLEGLTSEAPPVWLQEGRASFWQQTDIGDREVKTGGPSWSQLALLKKRKGVPIPLRELVATKTESSSR